MQSGDLVTFVERQKQNVDYIKMTKSPWHGKIALLIRDHGNDPEGNWGKMWTALLEDGSEVFCYSNWMEIVSVSKK